MNDPEYVPEPGERQGQAMMIFGIPDVPFSSVRVPLLDDERAAAELIQKALRAAKWTQEKYLATFPAQREEPRQPQRQQGRPPQRNNNRQPQQGGRGGRGEARSDKYARVDGECDICGGPVGRYPRTGNMRSDKAVCLGRCKDGDFIHTAFWLDEDQGGYDGDIDPDDLPF